MAEKRVAESAVVAGSVNSYLPINLPTYLPMLLFIMHKKVIIPHTPKKKKLSEIN
jgi:hypothetical protein